MRNQKPRKDNGSVAPASAQNNVFNPENIQPGDVVRWDGPNREEPGEFVVKSVGGRNGNKVYCAELPHEFYATCFKLVRKAGAGCPDEQGDAGCNCNDMGRGQYHLPGCSLYLAPKLTFEQFAQQYRDAFAQMQKYTPGEVGSLVWAERMAKLADEYPGWSSILEDGYVRGENVVLDEFLELAGAERTELMEGVTLFQLPAPPEK